jgi:plastocyanin
MKMLTALLSIGVLALAACGSSNNSSSSSSKTAAVAGGGSAGGAYGSSSSKSKTKATSLSSSGSGSNEVEMDDNYFKPKTITGKAGSTVKIELKNEGGNEHNFKIDSQKQADADVAPGKTATVSVKIPTSGTVQFYCEYHKGLGMVGTVKAS